MAKDRDRDHEKEMDQQEEFVCPACWEKVGKSHFACEFASKGGSAGTGSAKRRSPEHYKMMQARRGAVDSLRKGGGE